MPPETRATTPVVALRASESINWYYIPIVVRPA